MLLKWQISGRNWASPIWSFEFFNWWEYKGTWGKRKERGESRSLNLANGWKAVRPLWPHIQWKKILPVKSGFLSPSFPKHISHFPNKAFTKHQQKAGSLECGTHPEGSKKWVTSHPAAPSLKESEMPSLGVALSAFEIPSTCRTPADVCCPRRCSQAPYRDCWRRKARSLQWGSTSKWMEDSLPLLGDLVLGVPLVSENVHITPQNPIPRNPLHSSLSQECKVLPWFLQPHHYLLAVRFL